MHVTALFITLLAAALSNGPATKATSNKGLATPASQPDNLPVDPAKLVKDRKVVESILTVGNQPLDMAISPIDGAAYVTLFSPGKLVKIHQHSIKETVSIGANVAGIDISADGKTLYVGVAGGLVIVDTATLKVKHKVFVCSFPIGVNLAPNQRYVAVVCNTAGLVGLVSTDTHQVKKVMVGSSPYNAAISPDSGRVYVTSYGSQELSVVSVELEKGKLTAKGIYASLIKQVKVAGSPVGVVVSPNGDSVYVTAYTSAQLHRIDTKSLEIIETHKTGASPYFIALDPKGRYLLVSNYGAGHMDIFYKKKRTKITLQSSSVNVYISPDGKQIFLSNYNNGTVSIIE